MKMIVAIIQDSDLGALLKLLTKNNFSATKLASTGGFLKTGNTTLLIGVEDERLDSALHCIEATCKSRTMLAPDHGGENEETHDYASPMEVVVGGATVFIMNIAGFLHT